MNLSRRCASVAVLAPLALIAAACGSGDDSGSGDEAATSEPAPSGSGLDVSERPTVVVTTNILGDVLGRVAGDQADIVTIMPVGADPHDFQASAQEIDQLLSGDALIVNGADFEEGLLDVIESAESDGVPTFEAISSVSTIEFGGGHEHDDDEHADEEHAQDEDAEEDADEEHAEDEHDEDEHAHDGADPHFFTDPVRMADAVDGIVDFLVSEVDGIDPAALQASADRYTDELSNLDSEVEALVGELAPESRVLVTNHEVFAYFADRYGFDLVGAVIPGGTTGDAASAGELAELARIVESEGVAAIFADTSSSDDLVSALATEVGHIAVVELYSESLGEAGSDGATYLAMVRTNAERITSALA